jgi:hypothetical protein
MDESKVAHCAFCGQSLNHGFSFVCHVCGATYCYIHMGRHDRKNHAPTDAILA